MEFRIDSTRINLIAEYRRPLEWASAHKTSLILAGVGAGLFIMGFGAVIASSLRYSSINPAITKVFLLAGMTSGPALLTASYFVYKNKADHEISEETLTEERENVSRIEAEEVDREDQSSDSENALNPDYSLDAEQSIAATDHSFDADEEGPNKPDAAQKLQYILEDNGLSAVQAKFDQKRDANSPFRPNANPRVRRILQGSPGSPGTPIARKASSDSPRTHPHSPASPMSRSARRNLAVEWPSPIPMIDSSPLRPTLTYQHEINWTARYGYQIAVAASSADINVSDRPSDRLFVARAGLTPRTILSSELSITIGTQKHSIFVAGIFECENSSFSSEFSNQFSIKLYGHLREFSNQSLDAQCVCYAGLMKTLQIWDHDKRFHREGLFATICLIIDNQVYVTGIGRGGYRTDYFDSGSRSCLSYEKRNTFNKDRTWYSPYPIVKNKLEEGSYLVLTPGYINTHFTTDHIHQALNGPVSGNLASRLEGQVRHLLTAADQKPIPGGTKKLILIHRSSNTNQR